MRSEGHSAIPRENSLILMNWYLKSEKKDREESWWRRASWICTPANSGSWKEVPVMFYRQIPGRSAAKVEVSPRSTTVWISQHHHQLPKIDIFFSPPNQSTCPHSFSHSLRLPGEFPRLRYTPPALHHPLCPTILSVPSDVRRSQDRLRKSVAVAGHSI